MATPIPIVVASCAAYSDAWGPCLALLRRFWPGPTRQEPVLVTDRFVEGAGWDSDHFSIGNDLGWSANLMQFLSAKFGKDDVFLLLQEDFFLSSPVVEHIVEDAYEIIRSDSGIGCFRLFPCPGADLPLPDQEWYGQVSTGASYRISCQAALWRVSYIYAILSGTKSATSFELGGTEISRSIPVRILSLRRDWPKYYWPIDYICSAISRGKWNPGAIKLCRELGVPIDTSKRAVADV